MTHKTTMRKPLASRVVSRDTAASSCSSIICRTRIFGCPRRPAVANDPRAGGTAPRDPHHNGPCTRGCGCAIFSPPCPRSSRRGARAHRRSTRGPALTPGGYRCAEVIELARDCASLIARFAIRNGLVSASLMHSLLGTAVRAALCPADASSPHLSILQFIAGGNSLGGDDLRDNAGKPLGCIDY